MVGCGGGETPAPTPSGSSVAALPEDNWVAPVDAGNPDALQGQPPAMDAAAMKNLVASRSFSSRTEPFALHPEERAFETQQQKERLFQGLGGFYGLNYTPPPEVDNRPVFEEQPYRRLAGVIVGDSVLAIIEMGNGQPPQIIRPGQRIPNSEWTVVSINEEKAVLRRSGNKLPKEITVRLESKPPEGFGGAGGGGGTGGGPGNLGGGETTGGRGGEGGPGMEGPGG
jgi:hypothetical protein